MDEVTSMEYEQAFKRARKKFELLKSLWQGTPVASLLTQIVLYGPFNPDRLHTPYKGVLIHDDANNNMGS